MFQEIRPLAHPVANRFDDCGKGIILEACERLRRRRRPGTVVVSKKAMTRKIITNSITAKSFWIYLCRAIRAKKTHIWTAVAIGPWSHPSRLRDRIRFSISARDELRRCTSAFGKSGSPRRMACPVPELRRSLRLLTKQPTLAQ